MLATELKKINTKKVFSSTIMYVFLIIYAFITLFPVYFTIISSLKTDFDIFYKPFSLPEKLSFENYARAWKMSNFSGYFMNSIIFALSTCIILIFVSSMASYVLVKFGFSWRSKLLLYFLIGMMIPSQSVIVPLAYDIGKIGIKDSMTMVILMMVAFGIPQNILIYTGFMQSVPDELEEAAIIDGGGVFDVFTKIILPLSIPATITVTIINFLGVWNNFLLPLVFINKNDLQPIATGLLSFFGERRSDYSGVMAAIVISCSLPFLVYVFASDKIEKGLLEGGIKG